MPVAEQKVVSVYQPDLLSVGVKQFTFKRSQRLLTARDYKNTFDKTVYRFSTPALLVLAAEKADMQPARLGLIAAKKHLKLAVERNRFKRIARESFRRNQQLLTGFDLVVLVKAGAKNASRQEIHQTLEKAWPYIVRKRDKQSKKDR